MDRSKTTDRADRVRELQAQLESQVAEIVTSADWRAMLDTASRFHSYSFGNLMLIMAQCPTATRVAGYRTWQSLNRHVRKGEHGIRILAPCRYKTTSDDGEETWRIGGFTTVAVFNVAQTDGEDLDDVRPALLDGDAPAGLWGAIAAQIVSAGFTIRRGDCEGANGVTDYLARTVTVRADVSDAQACKTLTHELGHILCEHETELRNHGCRGRFEVEAESVAYIVAHAHGLPSGGYSLPYVAAGLSETSRWSVGRLRRSSGSPARSSLRWTPRPNRWRRDDHPPLHRIRRPGPRPVHLRTDRLQDLDRRPVGARTLRPLRGTHPPRAAHLLVGPAGVRVRVMRTVRPMDPGVRVADRDHRLHLPGRRLRADRHPRRGRRARLGEMDVPRSSLGPRRQVDGRLRLRRAADHPYRAWVDDLGTVLSQPPPADTRGDDAVKVVAYLRVSTDRQAEHGLGLEVQAAEITKWAKINGHRIVLWARDEGVSGSNSLETRQALPDALAALQSRTAAGMVVYRLDRLARDLVLQEQLLAEIKRIGSEVFSTSAGEAAFLADDPPTTRPGR